jgi:hypothetical protein
MKKMIKAVCDKNILDNEIIDTRKKKIMLECCI